MTNKILTANDEMPKNSAIPPHTPDITLSRDDFLNLLLFTLLPPLSTFLCIQFIILETCTILMTLLPRNRQNHYVLYYPDLKTYYKYTKRSTAKLELVAERFVSISSI